MQLMLILLASVVAATNADCEACINGRCHSRKILLVGFRVSDKMAIDRLNNILYVQTNATEHPKLSADNPKIQMVQARNMTAMTVDQYTQVLYTTDTQKKLYKHEEGDITTESDLTFPIDVKKILFHHNDLYYLTQFWNDNVLLFARIPLWYHKEDYPITDFVVDKDDNIFFVSNNTLYVMHHNVGRPRAIMWGIDNFVLSTDKFGDVYFGDATLNVIYRISNGSDKLIPYAAYRAGSVNEFVFDDGNNIVFHDSDKGTVNIWKPHATLLCHIGKLHAVPEIILHDSSAA